jgi:hypothetical protein
MTMKHQFDFGNGKPGRIAPPEPRGKPGSRSVSMRMSSTIFSKRLRCWEDRSGIKC